MPSDRQGDDIAPLIELVHHRWCIPVIAELHARNGAKFITLVNALRVGRASLSSSLKHLIDLGLARKNPGHGHPLRPEYLLTDAGRDIGQPCLVLTRLLRKREEADLAFRKWTLPLIAAIGTDVRRFNEIRNSLPDASPRAVALGLKALTGQRWAVRTLIDDYPPAAGYALLPKGRRILECIGELY